MMKEDLWGFTSLIYSNINLYGRIQLDMTERLAFERAKGM
jgi:hypothetical protein